LKNKISLLGLFGFLGLLGLTTQNPGFYGFFGFFGFFGFAKVLPDEMFRLNVNKASRNAFFTGLVLYPAVVVIGAFTSISAAYAFGFAINFAVQILVFSISLSIYER